MEVQVKIAEDGVAKYHSSPSLPRTVCVWFLLLADCHGGEAPSLSPIT